MCTLDSRRTLAGVVELADTQVLGTCVFGRAGSSPASRTHWILYRPELGQRLVPNQLDVSG